MGHIAVSDTQASSVTHLATWSQRELQFFETFKTVVSTNASSIKIWPNIYSKPKVTLHYLFLNISSVVLNCNKVSIGLCLLHMSEHIACRRSM